MKKSLICIFLMSIGSTAMASNLEVRGPLVLNWVKNLPALTSLQGPEGCEAISFSKDSNDSDAIVALKIGEQVSQGWLGIEGELQINSTTLSQDNYGGGIDGPQYHYQLKLEKSSNKLTSVQYRYYRISGIVFKKEKLLISIDCGN